MKILAVDLGERRSGLAVSDPYEKLALAHPTIEMTGEPSKDASRIVKIAEEQGAEVIVLGLPVNMDGTEGPRAEEVRGFADELKYVTEIPVEFCDERLSTVEGESRLREAGLYRKEMSRRSDSAAAIVILERFLESRRGKP